MAGRSSAAGGCRGGEGISTPRPGRARLITGGLAVATLAGVSAYAFSGGDAVASAGGAVAGVGTLALAVGILLRFPIVVPWAVMFAGAGYVLARAHHSVVDGWAARRRRVAAPRRRARGVVDRERPPHPRRARARRAAVVDRGRARRRRRARQLRAGRRRGGVGDGRAAAHGSRRRRCGRRRRGRPAARQAGERSRRPEPAGPLTARSPSAARRPSRCGRSGRSRSR